MIEFVDNGNNIDVINQIPIYIGGYIIDENDGLFKRNGDSNGISEWKNSEELNVLKRLEGKKMIEFVN